MTRMMQMPKRQGRAKLVLLLKKCAGRYLNDLLKGGRVCAPTWYLVIED